MSTAVVEVAVTGVVPLPTRPEEELEEVVQLRASGVHQDAAGTEVMTTASQSIPAAPAQPAKKLRQFKDAAELKTAFDEINSDIQNHTSELVRGSAVLKTAWDGMLPHLDKMQSLLSERGSSKAERDAYATMLRDAKLPGWMEYFDGLKLDVGLRVVQMQLKEYRRKTPEHLVAGQQVEHVEFGIGTVIHPMQTHGKVAVKFEGDDKDKIIDVNSAYITAIDGVGVGKRKKTANVLSANKQLLVIARRMVRLVLSDGDGLSNNSSRENLVKMLKAEAAEFRKLDAPKGEPAILKEATQPAKVIIGKPTKSQAAQPAPPLQAWSFRQSPLVPSNKYTVRPHPQGGFGVYEPGSPVCLERHPTQDAAWDAIDAVNAVKPSVPGTRAQIHR